MRMLVVIGLMLSGPVSALETIHDTGTAIPVERYYRQIDDMTKSARAAVEGMRNKTSAFSPIMPKNQFPLATTLQPGHPVEINAELPVPVYVIGLDPVSLAWVERSIDQLRGQTLLVVAGTEANYNHVKHLLAPYRVALEIGPGDALAKQYGLTTYPVIIR